MTPQERIKADANTATSELNKNELCGPIELMGYRKGYIAGATSEHEKTEAAIDAAIHKERNALQAKVTQMDMDWLKRSKVLVDALEAIAANSEHPGIKSFASKALEQWKGGKPDRPCPHCGKELSRDRNICCRECGKEVSDGA